MPGAVFEFRLDDGDGTYEPAGDDAPLLAEVSATNGFAVFTPSETGDYWVTESTPPPGLEDRRPDPRSTTPHRRRIAVSLGSALRCEPDDDQSGGFLIVVVVDSPIGGVGPEVTAPPTDTVPGDDSRPVDIVPAAALILIVAAVVSSAARSRGPGDQCALTAGRPSAISSDGDAHD